MPPYDRLADLGGNGLQPEAWQEPLCSSGNGANWLVHGYTFSVFYAEIIALIRRIGQQLSSRHMHERPLLRIRNVLAQDLVCDGSNIAFPKEEKTEHIHDRISFDPLEVRMR